MKLTDTQLIVLSAAAARDDGAGAVPRHLGKAAASKVGASLVARKLMREIRTKAAMPVWREDGDGRSFSLVITRAGRDAIGVEDDGGAGSSASAVEEARIDGGLQRAASLIDPDSQHSAESGENAAEAVTEPQARLCVEGAASPEQLAGRMTAPLSDRGSPRTGTKQALLIAMLQRAGGATVAELMAATGWLSHTVRAALTGLRKRGLGIERSKGDDLVTRYSVAGAPADANEDHNATASLAKAA